MIQMIGEYSLAAAVLASAGSMMAGAAAARFESEGLLRLARAGIAAILLLFTVASMALLWAFLDDMFIFSYVAGYSEKALPLGYKIAAFWAGQEGSLLLWAWMIAAMGLIAVFTWWRTPTAYQGIALATVGFVCGFFAALMLYAANPFATLGVTPADGQGLNPMLQDPGMLAHPPLLFLGYAGFTFPFAALVAALIMGRRDNDWLNDIRRWTMMAWLFLTIGIVLGAEWAYVELGWGGYWAWDPVENASLLPWLTGTALLHSIMAQQRRGMFKVWNAVLIALTFILCIFGTYLTRSGIVQSVHTFGASLVGTFFCIFLLATLVASAGLILWRLSALKAERPLHALVSREGAFLAINLLMLVIMLTTLVGTIFPVLSGPFAKKPIELGQGFYNSIVVPMSMLVFAMMAIAPLLFYGADAGTKLAQRIRIPAAGAVLGVAAAFLAGIDSFWALLCVAITAAAVLSILVDFVTAYATRLRTLGENPLLALARLVAGTHRRYGAQVAHVGVIMFMIGAAGSALYSLEKDFQLTAGQQVHLGGHTLTYQSLEEVRQANYTSVQALVTLQEKDGSQRTMRPEVRFYDKSEKPMRDVAIRSTWREDVYVILAGWDNAGQTVTVQVKINPLMNWLWTGTTVLVLGGLIVMLPRLAWRTHTPETARVPAAQSQSEPAAPAATEEPEEVLQPGGV